MYIESINHLNGAQEIECECCRSRNGCFTASLVVVHINLADACASIFLSLERAVKEERMNPRDQNLCLRWSPGPDQIVVFWRRTS
jgi:hypothetical protein